MPAGTKAVLLQDFTGGIWLNDVSPPDERYAVDLLNLDFGMNGGLYKRHPMRFVNQFSATGDLIVDLHTTGLAHDSAGGNSIYYSRVDAAVNQIIVAASAGALPAAATMIVFGSSLSRDDTFYIAFGTAADPRRATTAAVVTALGVAFNDNLGAPVSGNMPRSHRMTTHLAYMFIANTHESGAQIRNRIRWSHPGRFEDWRSFDFIDVGDKGEQVMDIYSYLDQLVIIKEHSVWVLTGSDPSNFALHRIFQIDNTLSGTSIISSCVASNVGVFFYSELNGFYWWNAAKLTRIDGPVRDAVRDARLRATGMVATDERLYVVDSGVFSSSIRTGGSSAPTADSLCWEYVFKHGAWLKNTGGWSLMIPITPSGTNATLNQHLGHTFYKQSSTAYTQGSYKRVDDTAASSNMLDNHFNVAAPYQATYRSPWIDGGLPANKKRWRRPYVVFGKRPKASTSDPVNYTMNVYRNYDGVHVAKTSSIPTFEAADTLEFDTEWGYGHQIDGSSYQEGLRIGSLGRAYAVQLELKSTQPPNDPWVIESITFKYIPKRLR